MEAGLPDAAQTPGQPPVANEDGAGRTAAPAQNGGSRLDAEIEALYGLYGRPAASIPARLVALADRLEAAHRAWDDAVVDIRTAIETAPDADEA